MNIFRFLSIFRSVLALSIIALLVGCGGDGGGSDSSGSNDVIPSSQNLVGTYTFIKWVFHTTNGDITEYPSDEYGPAKSILKISQDTWYKETQSKEDDTIDTETFYYTVLPVDQACIEVKLYSDINLSLLSLNLFVHIDGNIIHYSNGRHIYYYKKTGD